MHALRDVMKAVVKATGIVDPVWMINSNVGLGFGKADDMVMLPSGQKTLGIPDRMLDMPIVYNEFILGDDLFVTARPVADRLIKACMSGGFEVMKQLLDVEPTEKNEWFDRYGDVVHIHLSRFAQVT